MIYLDNAATSWPKPEPVAKAMVHYLNEIGGNPGRAGHSLANEAGHVVDDTRELVSDFFGAIDPLRTVFTKNVTEAINLALYGLLRPGDHVVTSSMEHNAIMRPLRDLEHQGVELSVVPCSSAGLINPDDVRKACKSNTHLVAINHVSNVTGTIQPIFEIGQWVREMDCLFLVDAAQSAGVISVDMESCCIDLLGFTGHKALYGPMGTGGLLIGQRVSEEAFRPLLRGGTGSRSQHEEMPAFLPDLLECGTPNVVGLAGLHAGISWIEEVGMGAIRHKEMSLVTQTLTGLQNIEGVTLNGPQDASLQTGNVSFTVQDLNVAELGLRLDEEYDILCRVGLHCSPATHKTLGTFPEGTVRLGFGYFNASEEVDKVVDAIERISHSKQGN